MSGNLTRVKRLSRAGMEEAMAELAARDPDLARAHREAGTPGLRHRPGGFGTLLDIILAQQLSARAAETIRGRLRALAEPLTPETFLALDDSALRATGFSRQKILYGRHLAEALAERRIELARIHRMADEEAIEALVALKGIGRWSAEIYLLFALRRPDIWPVDDLAVAVAVQRLKGLRERPNRVQMLEIAEPWRPWRSYAARLMWHYYRNAPS
jgi:DNA-3-methyladenine glycosylase II